MNVIEDRVDRKLFNLEDRKLFSLNMSGWHYRQNGFISKLEPLVERILSLDEFNRIYTGIVNEDDDRPFTDKVLSALNIDYKIPLQDLGRIPQTGPLIVVSNHPFGMIEGIILAKILTGIRNDVKIMANYLLANIPELKDSLITADPFGVASAFHVNFKAMRQSIAWLRKGGVLVVFPSGEVSRFSLRKRQVIDPQWSEAVARMVRISGASVLPVSFNGSNSAFFHGIGLINPRMRTFMLPHQLLNKSDKTIYMKMGKPIAPERLMAFHYDSEMMCYIRAKTYLLRNYWDGQEKLSTVPRFPFIRAKKKRDNEEIVDPIAGELLKNEINGLTPESVLIENGDYRVMYAKGAAIPNILMEIGRLREVTFRSSGEGTGRAIDLDRFDAHYLHIFTWNVKMQEIVGAYRLGLTDEILAAFGKKGLYTSTLFKYGKEFLMRINPAIELGRSFIRHEYQKVYSSLLLLWKGIARYISLNPKYKTLFGLVSINGNYKADSVKLMVDFLKMNNFDHNLSRMVRPRTPFIYKVIKGFDLESTDCGKMDLNDISGMVSDIEEDSKGVPILLKHYLKLGGTLLGFNIDTAFSNVVDSLILVDLTLTDSRVMERFMGEKDTREFYKFHHKEKCDLISADSFRYPL